MNAGACALIQSHIIWRVMAKSLQTNTLPEDDYRTPVLQKWTFASKVEYIPAWTDPTCISFGWK